jgi:superfamily I DNA and/or RNA helicase
MLRERLGEDYKVGTVDKFQGQEASIVIISMTTSSKEEMPRDIEFLMGHQRINVAISRAKILSVFVMSYRLTLLEASSIQEMRMTNLLTRLIVKNQQHIGLNTNDAF